jgi:uncharacterized RDD family membrane protein YckC
MSAATDGGKHGATIQRDWDMNENTDNTLQYAGIVRRLMAIMYDLFLLLAILFIATAIAMIFNQGNAIEPGQAIYPYYIIYLLVLSFVFYGWFWTHGGQTLGMKTWKMRLQQEDGTRLSWRLAMIRFAIALISVSVLGLGFIWALFEPKKRCWHDLASRSVLVDLRNR